MQPAPCVIGDRPADIEMSTLASAFVDGLGPRIVMSHDAWRGVLSRDLAWQRLYDQALRCKQP